MLLSPFETSNLRDAQLLPTLVSTLCYEPEHRDTLGPTDKTS